MTRRPPPLARLPAASRCPPAVATSAVARGGHDLRLHGAGSKLFHHVVVGDLDLAYESVDMISDPGLTLTIYAAEPGSPTAHALDLLASRQATEDAETAAAA